MKLWKPFLLIIIGGFATVTLCTCTKFSTTSQVGDPGPDPEVPDNLPSTPAEILSPYSPFRAIAHSAASGVCEQSKRVACASAGDHLRFDSLNFGTRGASGLEVTLAVAPAVAGEKIDLRLGSATGPLLGSLVLTSTGGTTTFQMQAGTMIKIKGTQTVALVFPGATEVGPIEKLRLSRRIRSARSGPARRARSTWRSARRFKLR